MCLCTMIAMPIWAEVYKWLDKDGNVHYGDKPPDSEQNVDAEAVHIREKKAESLPNADAATRQEYQKRLLEAMSVERQQKKEDAKNVAAEQEKASRNCARAKDNLRGYREAGFLYDLDKKGERVVLSDEQRRLATAKAQSEVDKWCK